LRRVIQKQLTDRLALALLEGKLRDGDSVRVDAVGGDLTLSTAKGAQKPAPAPVTAA
jgi:ATP-dependent Clp protease ATP-binding subunit ClpB